MFVNGFVHYFASVGSNPLARNVVAPCDANLCFASGRRLLQLHIAIIPRLHDEEVEVFFSFPRTVEIYASGLGDSYIKIASADVPMPTIEGSFLSLCVPACTINIPEVSSMRSRTWKVRISRVHETFVRVTRDNGEAKYSKVIGRPIMSGIRTSIGLKIFDSGLCVDLFQELHLLTNLCDVLESRHGTEPLQEKWKLSELGDEFRAKEVLLTATPSLSKISSQLSLERPTRQDLFGGDDDAMIEEGINNSNDRGAKALDYNVKPYIALMDRKRTIEETFLTQVNDRRQAARYRVVELMNKTVEIEEKLIAASPGNQRQWWLLFMEKEREIE